MAKEWQILEFGALLEGGARNGIYKPKQFHGTGAKMVNMGELFAYPRLRAVEMRRVQVTEEELQRFGLQTGDLLFARRSLVAEGAGKCNIVCEVDEPTTFESSIIRARPNPLIADSLYLYYFFNSPLGKYSLGTILRQVAVSGITGSDLVRLQIPIPSPNEQRAIAHIFGTLDDKIELNRRMNKTLEAIARAIFKSWFVDFDPVRAKAEGRQPVGMDAEIAALFPSKLEDSVLGMIPKGWKVGKVSEIANLRQNTVNPGNYPEEEFDHYSIPAFDEGRLPKAETGNQIKSNKFIVPHESVLLSKLNPSIPRIWLPNVKRQRRSICSTEFLVTAPLKTSTLEYLYTLFGSQSFLDVFATLVTGTSGSHQRVKPEYLLNMDALIPPVNAIEVFTRIVAPLLEKASQNLEESRTLAALRDALLPKLLSGEIRMKDAERNFMEAG